jgi:hypothetical protein
MGTSFLATPGGAPFWPMGAQRGLALVSLATRRALIPHESRLISVEIHDTDHFVRIGDFVELAQQPVKGRYLREVRMMQDFFQGSPLGTYLVGSGLGNSQVILHFGNSGCFIHLDWGLGVGG